MNKPVKKNTPAKPAFRKLYENIIENMPDGVAVIDKDLTVKVFNQSIQELTGLSSKRVLNKPFETVFSENPSLKKLVKGVFKSGTTYTDFDQMLTSRYKKDISVGVTASPLLDANGAIEGVVLTVRDLTHIKRLEEALRRKDKFSTLGNLSAGMAHEIKNPLVGIKGAAQLLRGEFSDETTEEYTNVIIKEVDRINRIVEELLSISHPSKPKMEPFNIHRVLDQVLVLEKAGSKGKKISFMERYDPSLPHIMGDEKQLTQVFLNLIRNSIESIEGGGKITLTTGISSERVVDLHTQMVLIKIEDNGKGIPGDIKEDIFTPFFTTKKAGTGLGLSVTHRIVEEHKGRLEIASNKEKGTVVRVYLPVFKDKKKKQKRQKRSMTESDKGLEKILVVDDEESIRWVFQKGLEKKGYQVKTVETGEDAIVEFQKSPYPLVFMDIRLPGMSGLDALERIKEIDRNAFVIVITAQATMKNAIEAMKRGAYDYLIKPFDLDQIYLIINKVLEIKKLLKQASHIKGEGKDKPDVDELIGKSDTMQEVYKTIGKVANKDVTVLITGESGTGKELVAKILHYNNTKRADRPFVVVNCASIPKDLLESELFGHKKGAFTGAVKSSIGMFEQASGGTVFLDEIGDMDIGLQTKILRVLQEKEFYRVGDVEPIRVDVRVIAATNRDLEEAIQEGQFREDLYYRLNVVPILLPSLKERREDIPLLIDFFLKKFSDMGLGRKHISQAAKKMLVNNSWKGNVRELENMIKRAVVLASSDTILPEDLPLGSLDQKKIKGENNRLIENIFEEKFRDFISKMCTLDKGNLYGLLIKGIEKPLIKLVLEETNGNQIKAAGILGINRNTLRKKMSDLKLSKNKKKK